MSSEPAEVLRDPLLTRLGIAHGFGRRGSGVPSGTCFARQVHGAELWEAGSAPREPGPPDADVVITGVAGRSVGVVTADCVPILAARRDGAVVAAIHAGWRGISAGVIEAGIAALRGRADGQPLVAAIGPAARGCCYEVDEPVRAALLGRHAEGLGHAQVLRATRAGHFLLDLALLAERILLGEGIEAERLGTRHRVCSICDPQHFESYRRDGAAAGRARHFITTAG